jgi:glycosyltransferase involved in cell wall biosynthesis
MHVLVDAAPALLAAHPDAHVVIVGGRHEMEARYEADLFAQIDRLGLKERVIMAGFQTNVPEWMQAMDIIVHASDNEPFGIVVIEAMALGKPVVAGNAAGPTEIITEGVDGILTPYGDAQRLA